MPSISSISSAYAAQVDAALRRPMIRINPYAKTADYVTQSRGTPLARRNHKTDSFVFGENLITAQLA